MPGMTSKEERRAKEAEEQYILAMERYWKKEKKRRATTAATNITATAANKHNNSGERNENATNETLEMTHINASPTSLLFVVVNVRLFPTLKRVAARRSREVENVTCTATRYASFRPGLTVVRL
jgi:hypothetical protein